MDEQTANMIAAGEVVERPMGVAKELVENAIDAGATRIDVLIEEGGMKKLTVQDNGCGMDSADTQMAFQRHATSKIKSQNDLWSIHTLGFRGEALPSIASVSKLTMVTSDGNDATKIVVEYGKIVQAMPYPCNQGTQIGVEGLFYKTPARLKHMRSASYESSLVQDVVMKFALSHPEIAFHFYNEGKCGFSTSGQGDLTEVLYAVAGRAVAQEAIPVSFSDYDYKVNGLIVKPTFSRASRNLMNIFLNGRMVKTYRLYKAVQEAYGSLIADGRYPIVALNVEMDSHILDVNVHPSKWEVRLSKENQLIALLKEGIKGVLCSQEALVEMETPRQQAYYQPMSFDPAEFVFKNEEPVEVNIPKEPSKQAKPIVKEEKKPKPKHEVHEEEREPFPALTVLGLYKNKYMACQASDGIALVDVKRARERVAYEECLRQLSAPAVQEELLVPLAIHASDDMVRRLDEINAQLEGIGVVFEPFGHDTLMARRIPSWLKNMDAEAFFADFVDAFKEDSSAALAYSQRHKVALAACAHVKAGHMSPSEMTSLLAQLSQCENCFYSPKGKAILVMINDKTIEKEFG